jgi:superfamily I DNA/RNA helicase
MIAHHPVTAFCLASSCCARCTGKQLLVQMEEQGLRPFVNLNAGLRARLATQYDEYVLLLAREGLVDFDDLLCHAVHILQHHPEVGGGGRGIYG